MPMKTQTAAVLEAVSSRIVSATGDRGFESFSLQRRVSDEPLLTSEPSRSASVQETAGGSTGQPKNLRGTDGSNPSPSSGESDANITSKLVRFAFVDDNAVDLTVIDRKSPDFPR
jgi:hypothetical protein